MAELGRIVHHLKNNIGTPATLSSWWAGCPDTLGSAWLKAAVVSIFGNPCRRKAEVENHPRRFRPRREDLWWSTSNHSKVLEEGYLVHVNGPAIALKASSEIGVKDTKSRAYSTLELYKIGNPRETVYISICPGEGRSGDRGGLENLCGPLGPPWVRSHPSAFSD